jgi:hypothetical protein
MTIRTTRWRPDTCDCIIEYNWDDSTPLNARTFNLDRLNRKCTAHENLQTDMDVWNTVMEENPRKNHAVQTILDNAPSQAIDINAEDGSITFKRGISVYWSWSGIPPNRLLTIIVYGITLTQNQINSINTKLDERFGISNVMVVNG